jgi:hypothetical protein
MFAAIAAALIAALLSLGGASLVLAGQPEGKGVDKHADSGNGNNKSDEAPAAVAPQSDHGSSTPAPAPSRGNGHGNTKQHRSAPKHEPAPTVQPTPQIQAAPTATGGGSNSTATSGPGNSSQGCDGSHNSDTGHGANQSGPYDNTCTGAPSGNGNGNGQATGKPCAGCVGNADDKNPKGQMPNGSDHNAGYECDRNHGIGRTNPAHTGCTTTTPPPCTKDCTPCTKDCTPCTKDCAPCQHDCTPPTPCPTGSKDCTPPPTTTTSTSTPPPQQAVLGAQQPGTTTTGTSPAHTAPANQQEVLGEQQSGTSPASTTPASGTAPAVAQQTQPASANKQLPFTGTDGLAVLIAGALLLAAGIGMRRLATHQP